MVIAAQQVTNTGDVEPAVADLEESTAFLIGHEREVIIGGVWSWLQWRNLGLVTLFCLATTSVAVGFSGMMRSREHRAPLRGVQAQSLMGTPWLQTSAKYCHTAQPGELCYSKVKWAMEVDIPRHPEIYNFKLSNRSSPTEIQEWLHRSRDVSGCPMPCPAHEVTTTTTTSSTFSAAQPWGAVVQGACNPTTCPTGLTCSASSVCCEEYDWDCCGTGTDKYANRQYCPSQSRYHIMCGNGECADSDDACEGKGGVKYGAAVCSKIDGFLGCYKQLSGFGIVQPSPQWCDSVDKCSCPAEFPFVAYFNGNVTGHRNEAQWSCLRTMPQRRSASCIPYGSWYVGTNGPNAAIYHNPHYKSAQLAATVMTSSSTGASTGHNIPCHTAMRNEHCFDLVLWAIREGIHEHPDWFHTGITERSTFEEVQAALAQSESSGCPKPCAPSADVGTSTFGSTGAGNFKMGGPGCHTATVGEECYNFVKWSMAAGVGITSWHPSFNTSGLNSRSTFEEFQSVLHRDAETHCPVPCAPGEGERAKLFSEAVEEVRRDREEKEREEQEEAIVADDDEERSCGLIEVGKDYPGNDLYAVAEVESAGHCCTLCTKEEDCVAWSWQTDRTKPDGEVCYLKGASPRPTLSRVNDSTFTSGQPMKAGKIMPVRWPSPGLSMYCITTVSPQGYDRELIPFQYKFGTGIFACDQYDVFSNESFAVAPGFFTRAVRGNMAVRAGELLPGMDMVTGVWELVGKEKQYQRFDWTVKVAPDAILLAKRLQTKLLMHAELPQGSYLNNCAEGLKDAIMVLSRNAAARLSSEIEDCVQYAGELREALWWREARFLDVCLEKVLGVYRDNDWSLMYSEGCSSPAGWSNCKDGLVPAFHPFRAEGGYRQCLLNAEMSR